MNPISCISDEMAQLRPKDLQFIDSRPVDYALIMRIYKIPEEYLKAYTSVTFHKRLPRKLKKLVKKNTLRRKGSRI